MSKYIVRIIVLAVLASAVVVALTLTPLGAAAHRFAFSLLPGVSTVVSHSDMTTIESLVHHKAKVLAFVNGNLALFGALFAALYLLATALSLPVSIPLTFLSGFLFGPFLGTLFVNIGATAGAALVFLLARYFFGNLVQERYRARLASFNGEIRQNGRSYLLTCRLIPFFPFFVVNLLAGLTTIRLSTFLWTTSLGTIPGTFAWAYAGFAGATLGSSSGYRLHVGLALLLLATVSLVPVIIKKIRTRRSRDGWETGNG